MSLIIAAMQTWPNVLGPSTIAIRRTLEKVGKRRGGIATDRKAKRIKYYTKKERGKMYTEIVR